MAPKKRRTTRRRVASRAMSPTQPYNYPYPPPQQPNKMLYALIILNILFTVFLFYKLQGPGAASTTSNTTAQTGSGTNAQDASVVLSIASLKKYAKDMRMDTNKFNQCLDSSAKKDIVAADAKQAAGLGVNGTPGFFINGRFLAGAFPFDNFKEIIDKELSGEANGTCDVYSTALNQYCAVGGSKGFDPAPKQVDLGNAPTMGPDNAKITLIEFSDFQCPFCIRAYPTVKQILSTYPNDVKMYYKHLPLTQLHPYAQKAAEASECARDQGKFWDYYNKLFSSQSAS